MQDLQRSARDEKPRPPDPAAGSGPTGGPGETGAPGPTGGTDTPRQRAQRLLALYAALSADTAALGAAVEREQPDVLEARTGEREARLAAAAQLLASFGPGAATLPADLRPQVRAALEALQRHDDALRALLAARAQEIPAQLAALRVARRATTGYAGHPTQRSLLLDQKG
jgi:hypothetical protein